MANERNGTLYASVRRIWFTAFSSTNLALFLASPSSMAANPGMVRAARRDGKRYLAGKQIKGGSRAEKLRLVQAMNPNGTIYTKTV